MEFEKIRTRVVHSVSKSAWNVVGTLVSSKYKIARVPYHVIEDNEILTTQNKAEALAHATFISNCFNNNYNESVK